MKRLVNPLVAIASVLVALAVCELAVRIRLPVPSWMFELDPPEDALMIEDPRLGYALRPGKVEQWTREHWSVHIEVNSDGMRDDPLSAARAAPLRALAVGDSFTFGIGVEHGEAWPEALEQELTAREGVASAVVNTGVPGYSARQMRLRALDLLDRVDPALVVAALYANSYWRVKEPYVLFHGTLLRSGDLPEVAINASGDLIVTRFPPGALRDVDVWLKGHLVLPALVFDRVAPWLWPHRVIDWNAPAGLELEQEYQPALDELGQLRDALAARGIPLVILLVNAQQADGSFLPDEQRYNELVARFCAERGIPLANPLPRLLAEGKGQPIFRTPTDMHWRPLAHRIAAREVMRVTLANDLLAPRT